MAEPSLNSSDASRSSTADTCDTSQAKHQAADLNVMFDQYGQRDESERREVKPPIPVESAKWTAAGELDTDIMCGSGRPNRGARLARDYSAVELSSQRSPWVGQVVNVYVVGAGMHDDVQQQCSVVDLSAPTGVRVKRHNDRPGRGRCSFVNVPCGDRIDVGDLDRPAHLAGPWIDGHGCGSAAVRVALVRYTCGSETAERWSLLQDLTVGGSCRTSQSEPTGSMHQAGCSPGHRFRRGK
jgi:hypothetical protein